MIIRICKKRRREPTGVERFADSEQRRPHVSMPPRKIIIEEWDGDGAIRIPDEALQELELDVGDAVYLIEEFVGNTRCLAL